MTDGTLIYLEQVSMAPFTTHIYVIGPNEDFKFSATVRFELQVSMNLSHAKGTNTSNYKIAFKNGNEYKFTWPTVSA